jgi:probable rRNA maturation factor
VPELEVHIVRRRGTPPVPVTGLETFVRRAARAAGVRADELSILLAGDDEIRGLNRAYRDHDRVTDVLSFPGGGLPDGRLSQGDIAIAVPRAERQAAQRRHTLEIELRYLLLHGLLHLLGYDHETDDGEMDREEKRLRSVLDLEAEDQRRAGSGR